MTTPFPFIPYHREPVPDEEMLHRTREYFTFMNGRRSVRDFSDRPVPEAVITDLIRTASTAPSGAHKQPWSFCAIASLEIKRQIRKAAEAEEYASYHGRMAPEWLEDLSPLGTDWHKPFLEIAPWIIVVFKRVYEETEGKKRNNYYVAESVGLACGFLLAAIHQAGLVTLTHTPSPMNFLTKILGRPANERPFLLLPVGFPAEEARVPDLKRKEVEQVLTWYR